MTDDERKISITQDCVCRCFDRQQENKQRETPLLKKQQEIRFCEKKIDNVITIAFAAVDGRQQDNKERS